MPSLSIETCVRALNGAALARKAAFQTELAVAFAVFLTQGGTERQARQLLNEMYASAGNMCLTPADADYKTVNRRINAVADLFGAIKLRTVKQWAGKHSEDQLIAAMAEGLRPYELVTVADVLRYCTPAPQRAAAPQDNKTPVPPHNDILNGAPGTNHTGQHAVLGMFRRAADQVAKGADHVETKHLALMIPKDATTDELIEMAQKLLSIAQDRKTAAEPAPTPEPEKATS